MTATAQTTEDLLLEIRRQVRVRAPLETTFEALLDELGPCNARDDGTPLPMKLEAWPGGRWYRDLGGDNGHFWAHVQAIKRPTLLELAGPLFMSHPVANNLQYRLSAEGDGTLIKFRHSGFGLVQEDQRRGVVEGWTYTHDKIRECAEKAR